MRSRGGHRRVFGRASVSVAAIALLIFGPIATAHAETEIGDLMGPSAAKVSDAELSEQRGGFRVKGVMFNIAVDQMKTVNGQVEYASHLVADQHGWKQTVYGHSGLGGFNSHGNEQGGWHQEDVTIENSSSAAPQTLTPTAPVQTVGDPVATHGDPITSSAAPNGPVGGIPENTAPVDIASAAITGGVELAVGVGVLPSAPTLPDVTSAQTDIAAAGADIPTPQAPVIPPVVPPETPQVVAPATSGGTSLVATVSPVPPTQPQPDAGGGLSTNLSTAGAPGTTSTPHADSPSFIPPSPQPKNVQILAENQPLTNETVRNLLYGRTVVVNDKNNVVIQQTTSITVDITNFSSVYSDALGGQLARSIADLIRAQTTTSLIGF